MVDLLSWSRKCRWLQWLSSTAMKTNENISVVKGIKSGNEGWFMELLLVLKISIHRFLKKKKKNGRNEKQQQQRTSVADAWKGIDRGSKGGFTKLLLFWKHGWLDLKVAKINIPGEQRWIHEDIVSIAWVYIKKNNGPPWSQNLSKISMGVRGKIINFPSTLEKDYWQEPTGNPDTIHSRLVASNKTVVRMLVNTFFFNILQSMYCIVDVLSNTHFITNNTIVSS